MLKLNLGCGRDHREGYLNVDNWQGYDPDRLHDLTTPWPWDSNTVDEIQCHQLLEHIPNIIFFMKEAHRVLKAGALFSITVPWCNGRWQSGDVTHCRQFNDESFLPWTDWFESHPHINQGAHFKKLTQTYQYDSNHANVMIHKHGGFSKIVGIALTLQKV